MKLFISLCLLFGFVASQNIVVPSNQVCSTVCFTAWKLCSCNKTLVGGTSDENRCWTNYTNCLDNSCLNKQVTPPYTFYLSALLDVFNVTTVEWDLQTNVTLPQSITFAEVLYYSNIGRYLNAQNYFNIPLNITGQYAGASVIYAKPKRYDWVGTLISYRNPNKIRNNIMNNGGLTQVLYRPDLYIDDVSFTQKAYTNQAVNFNVRIKEWLNDLGATSSVKLYQVNYDGTVVLLDEVDNVNTVHGGVSGMILQYTWQSVGAYKIKVAIENVEPGDYDYSNNAATFNITVALPIQSVFASAGAYQYNYTYNFVNIANCNNYNYYEVIVEDGNWMQIQMYIPNLIDTTFNLNFSINGVNIDNSNTFLYGATFNNIPFNDGLWYYDNNGRPINIWSQTYYGYVYVEWQHYNNEGTFYYSYNYGGTYAGTYTWSTPIPGFRSYTTINDYTVATIGQNQYGGSIILPMYYTDLSLNNHADNCYQYTYTGSYYTGYVNGMTVV